MFTGRLTACLGGSNAPHSDRDQSLAEWSITICDDNSLTDTIEGPPISRTIAACAMFNKASIALKVSLERALIKISSFTPGLSKSLFGTDAPLQSVIKGRLALRRARQTYTAQKQPNLISSVDKFASKGLLDLGQPFNPVLISNIAAAFNTFVEQDTNCRLRYESSPDIHIEHQLLNSTTAPVAHSNRVVHRTLLHPIRLIPDIMSLLDDTILELIEACHQCHVQLIGVTCWRNYHLRPNDANNREFGYSHYWHNDGQAIDTVKLFVALSTITDADGPLMVLPKDVTRSVMNWRFDRKQIRHNDELNAQSSKVTGPSGTAALCNTNLCLHRAGIPNPNRHRDMLQFLFKSHPTRDLSPPDTTRLH